MSVGTSESGDEGVVDPAEDVLVPNTVVPGDAVAGDAVAYASVDQAQDVLVPSPPVTGDAVVDEAMVELAEAQSGSNAVRIDAGERAHRTLQGRLADLGGA